MDSISSISEFFLLFYFSEKMAHSSQCATQKCFDVSDVEHLKKIFIDFIILIFIDSISWTYEFFLLFYYSRKFLVSVIFKIFIFPKMSQYHFVTATAGWGGHQWKKYIWA